MSNSEVKVLLVEDDPNLGFMLQELAMILVIVSLILVSRRRFMMEVVHIEEDGWTMNNKNWR